MNENLRRMLELVDEAFDVKNDPGQLNVTPKVAKRLEQIHPATLTEYNLGDGPLAWILVIPTLSSLMNDFISKRITEQQLADKTPVGGSYDCVYLCSASILPEYRRQGISKRMMVDAIRSIMEQHPIQSLFYWPFSDEGTRLAESVARELGLPLEMREGE